MNVLVNRHTLAPTSLLGDLTTEGGFSCHTLEPRPDRPEHPAIVAGTYGLTLEPTHNPRLWTPYGPNWEPDVHHLGILPHVWGVAGRTGIEQHAGNHSGDTEGCGLVGYDQGSDGVSRSRDALKDYVDHLRAAGETAQHQITYLDAWS